MDIDRLRTFLMAAEELSFTHAADRLNLSQPAVSQQVRELENRLKVTLFERRGRGLSLTPSGERLKRLAQTIVTDVQLAYDALAEFQGNPQGVLRIGASNTPGIYLLPYLLGSFSRLFPGVRPSLRIAETEGLVRILHEGELDFAMVEEDLSPGRIFGWEKIPLIDDELVLISSLEHAWSSRPIDLEELSKVPFIVRQFHSGARKLIFDQLAEAGFNPDRLMIRFELGHTEGIKRSVMAGLGMGFVSRYSIANELIQGSLVEVPIKNFKINRTLWLIRPSEKILPIHQQRFCEMLCEKAWLSQSGIACGLGGAVAFLQAFLPASFG